jgi:hypothetical protein
VKFGEIALDSIGPPGLWLPAKTNGAECMAFSYVRDPNQNLVRTTITGPVTVREILDHLAVQMRQGSLGWRELVDVCGVTAPYLTKSEIWQAAREGLAVIGNEYTGPRAIVVTNQIVYAQCRMFATLVEDAFTIRVFRDPVQAEHWLLEEYRIDSPGKSGADSDA